MKNNGYGAFNPLFFIVSFLTYFGSLRLFYFFTLLTLSKNTWSQK
jgi:hypothetical protein